MTGKSLSPAKLLGLAHSLIFGILKFANGDKLAVGKRPCRSS